MTNGPRSFPPQEARSRLRATIATVEQEIARLPREVTHDASRSAPQGLIASFTELVEQLALGPEPEHRSCPVCQHVGMRAATICGYCWTRLAPERAGDGIAT